MKHATSGHTMQALADRTTAEGLRWVRARQLTEALWNQAEQYHAGAIDYATWTTANHAIWDEIHMADLKADVLRHLRQCD